jgi:antitoxin VapB
MVITRAFKSGGGQVVSIPDDIAYEDGQELTITRDGDVVTVTPMRDRMKEAITKLRAMPKPDQIEVYEPTEMPDRDGL